MQYLVDGDITFVDLLRHKVNRDERHVRSLGDYFREIEIPELRLPHKRSVELWNRFERIKADSLARFEKGEYL